MRRFPYFALLALACLALPVGLSAKPAPAGTAKPIENENSVFPNPASNDVVRIVPNYFGSERPQDKITEHPADPSQRVLIFDANLTGAAAQVYTDEPKVLLTDADGVAADVRSMTPAKVTLQQNAAINLHVVYWAPNDFVPAYIVYTCQTTKCKTIRIKFQRLPKK